MERWGCFEKSVFSEIFFSHLVKKSTSSPQIIFFAEAEVRLLEKEGIEMRFRERDGEVLFDRMEEGSCSDSE